MSQPHGRILLAVSYDFFRRKARIAFLTLAIYAALC